MFCRNCGKEIPDGAAFCQGCGQPTNSRQPEPPEEPPKKKKGGFKKTLMIVIAALAVIVIIGALMSDDSDGKNESAKASATTPANTQSTQAETDAQPSTAASTAPIEETVAPAEPQYEITYQNLDVWTDSIDTVWYQVIIEITNTGNCDLYLDDCNYDLEDSSGNLVATSSLVSSFPYVISPGEKGYMYEQSTLDVAVDASALVVVPRIDVLVATIEKVQFDVSDVTVSDSDFGPSIMGRITNTTEEEETFIQMYAVLFDSNGTPIGATTYANTDIPAPGETAGFEMSGIYLPDYITASDVASVVVYAEPMQFQFS